MFCWPWKHEWKFIDIQSHSYSESSYCLYYCKKCGKFTSRNIYGRWSVDHKYEMEDGDGEKIIHLYKRD